MAAIEEITEVATPDNFNARSYLLANKDLLLALGSDVASAAEHFHACGMVEGRRQFANAFVASPEFEAYLETYLRTPPEVIAVFEPITPENFNATRYLLGNPDVHAAFGSDEAAAAQHLHNHGLKESRQQISAAFLSSRREKFVRFRHTLPACEAEAFPVHFGTSGHRRSEYAAESSNGMLAFWIAELAGNPDKLYADIGAGLRPVVLPNCVYVEVYPSISADILIDPDCRLPFEDGSLDGIGCFAVLEHVNKPWVMAAEFSRVLKPGGKIYVDWPFLQYVHGYPSHYYNATREGLRQLFAEQFEIDELYTGVWQGPNYTVSSILKRFVLGVKDETERQKLLDLTLAELCSEPPGSAMWHNLLREMDDATIETLSCGNMLVARRR